MIPSARPPTPFAAFCLHLLLALLWTALAGWSGPHFLLGLLLGGVAVALGERLGGRATYWRASSAAIALAGLFAARLLAANLQLARDILRRRPRFSPAILAFDIGHLGPLQQALLVSLVSLTPGTLSLDLDESERRLFVHSLYAADEARARREVERYTELLLRVAGRGAAEER